MSNLDVLVDCELDRHDWSQFRECTGPATNIPVALRQLLSATTEQEADTAYWRLENHAVVSGGVFESSLPLVPAVLAALVEFDRLEFIRVWLLDLLFQIVNGYVHADERARGVENLVEQCQIAARDGLWLLYRIYQAREPGRDEQELAGEIIRLIDPDKSRLSILEERNAARGQSIG